MVLNKDPVGNVLRIVCLLSVTNNGIPPKNFEILRQELIHSYGYGIMITLQNLEKVGLLKKQEDKFFKNTEGFSLLRKVLNLITEIDEKSMDDISYVYAG